jgi:superfamily II DNA or RNA helicase
MFQVPVGMLGGGSKEIREITVSTYDSAVLQMEYIGNKFGLIIFDECHHLPGQVNRMSASMCLAPYRLGLTATPERDDSDETDAVMRRILGKIVYRIHIDELEGSVLAPYVTHRIAVELTPEEEVEYHAARKKYIDFIRAMRIDFQDKSAWGRFVALCFQNKGGRAVFDAFLRQREIARCGSGKLQILWRIILKYPGARIIVFTADNDTAYKIGELFCLPVITHKTKATERKEFLDSFRSGEYPVLVTSKVLNEGVDVPEANVGIVFSGSGSTREHIQRLGRILRRTADGKQAVLYELVSAGTSEMSVSERRRNNRAYQKMPVPGEK